MNYKELRGEMGVLNLLYVASMPIVKVLLVSGLGAVLSTQYAGVLTRQNIKSLNKIAFMIFIPALQFASLSKSVTLEDLVSWWSMPINILLTYIIGTLLGCIVVKLTKAPKELQGIIISSCCSGNMGNLLLILIPNICDEKGSPFGDSSDCKVRGIGYVSFSMAIGSILKWTYAYSIISSSLQYKVTELERGLLEDAQNNEGSFSNSSLPKTRESVPDNDSRMQTNATSSITSWNEKLKQRFMDVRPLLLNQLKSPPNLGVAAGLFVGVIPQIKSLFVGESAPLNVVQDSISLLGDGTIPSIMLVLGGNLLRGLKSSKLKPVVIPLVLCARFLVMPLVGLFIINCALSLGLLPDDRLYRFILMIQFTVPPAINLGTIAELFNVGQQEFSVLFLWTYVIASFVLTFWSTVFMLLLLKYQ